MQSMTMKKIKLFFILFLFVLFGCNSSIVDDPSTSIRYKIEETSHVTIILLNSFDTEIATLVDEEKTPGTYEVSFSNNNLAEGIYFYTLELRGESGSYSKTTKQMLLIK